MGIPRIFAVQNDALQKEVQPGCSIVSVSASSYLVIFSLNGKGAEENPCP